MCVCVRLCVGVFGYVSVLWHINDCRLFYAKSILYSSISNNSF